MLHDHYFFNYFHVETKTIEYFQKNKPIRIGEAVKMKRYWLVAYDGIKPNGNQHVGNVDCWTEGPGNWTLKDVRDFEETMKRDNGLKMARVTNIMPLDPPRE